MEHSLLHFIVEGCQPIWGLGRGTLRAHEPNRRVYALHAELPPCRVHRPPHAVVLHEHGSVRRRARRGRGERSRLQLLLN